MKMYLDRLIKTFIPLLLVVFSAIPALAQTDPNPNSPTPVLLSASDSSRVLAISGSTKKMRGVPKESSSDRFATGSKVVLFVTNVELMDGEGRTAFRVYAEDALRHLYRFPVTDLQPVDKAGGTFALTVDLRDELGIWQLPSGSDVIVSVAWRGLESNRLILGLGSEGQLTTSTLNVKATSPTTTSATGNPTTIGYVYSGDRARFMEQATFGATTTLDNRVRRIGLRAWLAEQFDLPYPSAANPYPNFPLRPTTRPIDCNGQIDDEVPDSDPLCYPNHYTMYPVQNWFYKEAFYGDAQLRHKMAWALGQLWVISGVEIQQSSHMVQYHKVLSKNAFGNWRTLMQEMTLNPGMGDYLDMRDSTRFFANENFAREVMQLFNIGLVMLNQDGTVQTDNQGQPIPTYDQITINNLKLVFTGWSLCEASLTQCPHRSPGSPNFIDPMMVTNPDNVDLSAKTLLQYPGSTTTQNIPACSGCTGSAITTYATNSLNQALDNIYNHPNVAPFVSKFLIEQFVTGDPTPAYVGRISAVFNANRTSPTQLKEVIRAILLDPEARGEYKTEPRYGKLREPVMLVTSLARQFNARSFGRTTVSDGVLSFETNPMGQIAFMPPTVFNYYPPEYIVPGRSFNGPEFALFTTGTAIARINFVNTLVFNGVPVNEERRVLQGTSIDLSDMAALAAYDPTGTELLTALNVRMMRSGMSTEMRNTIQNAILTVPASDPMLRAKRAVYLVATSSQYQVQR
jgi:uncharacterized protein (DUF1800 family)